MLQLQYDSVAAQLRLTLDGRLLLVHSDNAPALVLGIGEPDVSMFRGNFEVSDRVTARRPLKAVDVQDRTARWYYFCSIAHSGMGNSINALNYARQAASMDPGNIEYQQLIQRLENGGQWYQSRGEAFGGRPVADSNTLCYLCLAQALCASCGGPVFCCI